MYFELAIGINALDFDLTAMVASPTDVNVIAKGEVAG
jgi:hypothetical protein